MIQRNLVCEFLGTAFLLATVVGSGILMHKLDAGNVAVTVMGVAIATGAVLYPLIVMFGSISAHFNPAVTLVNAIQGNLRWNAVLPYVVVQIAGAMVGVIVANLMFDGSAIAISNTARTGAGQWISELVATFGLIGVILGCSKSKPESVPQAVACYVAGAIMFTSSTCFANPAVSISRMLTGTITGIRPIDVLPFIGSEIIGAVLALVVFGWLFRTGGSNTAPAKATSTKSLVEKEDRELVNVYH
jgi:glycerol uptake facilitator-like aquaporin